MCDCKTKIEEKVKARIAEQHPEATEVLVSLTGYAFVFSDSPVRLKPSAPIEVSYSVPKKSGDGMKKVKDKMSMVASYCPYCGESLIKVTA